MYCVFSLLGGVWKLFWQILTLKSMMLNGNGAIMMKFPVRKLSRAFWRQGSERKERLQLRLWNLNICIKTFDVKC